MERFGVGILTCLALSALVPTWAADPTKKALEKAVTFEKTVENIPLEEILEHFHDKYEVTVRIDEAAFKKLGIERVPHERVNIPKIGDAPLAFLLEITAYQVGGTVRVDGNQISIVPGKRDPAEVLPAASDALKKKLAEQLTIEKDVDDAEFRDVVGYIGDRCGVQIILADWLFREAAKKIKRPRNVASSPCRLKSGTKKIEQWLSLAASQVGAKVVIRGDLVLMVPAPKDGP